MPSIKTSLDIFSNFIDIAQEIVNLPALILPQYQAAVQDMYQICQKLLIANENLSRWLHRFIYFDFRQNDARTVFMTALKEYKTMKSGPEFQQLKFSCNDISCIYDQHISSKIKDWFANKHKKEEVKKINTRGPGKAWNMNKFNMHFSLKKGTGIFEKKSRLSATRI